MADIIPLQYAHVSDGDLFVEMKDGVTAIVELGSGLVDWYDTLIEAVVDTGHYECPRITAITSAKNE